MPDPGEQSPLETAKSRLLSQSVRAIKEENLVNERIDFVSDPVVG